MSHMEPLPQHVLWLVLGGGGWLVGRDLNVEARGSSFHVQEAFKNLWQIIRKQAPILNIFYHINMNCY